MWLSFPCWPQAHFYGLLSHLQHGFPRKPQLRPGVLERTQTSRADPHQSVRLQNPSNASAPLTRRASALLSAMVSREISPFFFFFLFFKAKN